MSQLSSNMWQIDPPLELCIEYIYPWTQPPVDLLSSTNFPDCFPVIYQCHPMRLKTDWRSYSWLMAYIQESLSKIFGFQNAWAVSGWIIIFSQKWWFVNKKLQYSRWFDHVWGPCPHSNCIVFLQPYCKSMIWNTCWLMVYIQESLSKFFGFKTHGWLVVGSCFFTKNDGL